MAFVAMGLQVNPVKCDGWYNEFNKESYIESGYDAEKQGVLAKQSISDSVAYLKSPGNAGRFFLRKNASQWADPLFQSLWTSQVRQTQNERPGWLQRVLSPKGSTALGQFLDVLQFWAYAGALFYLIFGQAYSRNFLSVDAYNKLCVNKDSKIRMPKRKVNDDDDIVESFDALQVGSPCVLQAESFH